MKLRYLSNSANGPVLLFERADTGSVRALRTALESLVSGQAPAVELHRVPGIEAVDGCRLVALLSDAPTDPLLGGGFAWRLKPLQWESVLGLLEPLAAVEDANPDRHQYLGKAGPASVIISTSDHW